MSFRQIVLISFIFAATVNSGAQAPADCLPPCSGASSAVAASRANQQRHNAVQDRLPMVRTLVRVSPNPAAAEVDRNDPLPFHMTAEEILPSAGTYGDFTRYLQNMPGVVANGDWSDDLIVRGGNPTENLFVVDGIEIPNINQLVTEDSTGGLFAMLDTSAIDSVDLHTGGYNASYQERLSSVVDIGTREVRDQVRHGEANLGYIGAGGLTMMPVGRHVSLFGSAHRSMLNLISSNIGLGGTPVYSNMFLRGDWRPTGADDFEFLNLSGWDSIDMTPGGPGHNSAGTDNIDMQYAGWRSTNGMRWRHAFSSQSMGTLTASDSEQQENIQQENTFWDQVHITNQQALQLRPVLVYSQLSHDGRSNLRYDFLHDSRRKWSLMLGSSAYLNHVSYRIAQPRGEQSPLSVNPTATDADSFSPDFLSGETGSYVEGTYRPLARWSLSAGGRLQSFATGGRRTLTPRLNTAFLLTQHTGVHAAFADYAQMPPMPDLTSWPQNRQLLPIRARHLIVGADLYTGEHLRVAAEAYQKNYRDYPVSTEYPSLSLANMVDEFGHQILWLPLTSRGTGMARGVELSTQAHLGAHFSGGLALTWAHADFAGLDGVLRPGNFDYRFVGNTTGTWRSGKRYEVSWRYQYTTGRPYTPFLLSQSIQQNRPIYDLSHINGARGPAYSRLDIEVTRSFYIGNRRLVMYLGLDNAFDHKNFIDYEMQVRVNAYWGCQKSPTSCIIPIYGFSRFPDGGLRYYF